MPAQVRTGDLQQELAGLAAALRAIVEGLPALLPTEIQVWTVYAGTEKVVAILKFRLGVERPGVFTELPSFQRSTELLPVALEKMTDATQKIRSNQLVDGLAALRSARDNLRAYLSEERRVRMGARRRAAASRPSS